jgi:hypothetical protein
MPAAHAPRRARAVLPPVLAIFYVIDKGSPGGGGQGQPQAGRVFGVADQVSGGVPGDFDAVVTSVAAAGLAPAEVIVWSGLVSGQGVSSARSAIMAAEPTATAAAGYPRRQGTVESQVRRTGTSDPGLLLHAAAIDSAARAVLARAAQDAARVAPSPSQLPAATSTAVQNGHAPASSTRRTAASPPQNAARRGSAPARERD